MFHYVNKESFKISTISSSEIDFLLLQMMELRKIKMYNLADWIKDNITECGYYFISPDAHKVISKSCIMGNTIPRMKMSIKDSSVSLEGYIHLDNRKIGITDNINKKIIC